jgi:phosphoenolpyruvate-protein kinase (PTS system EI component)
LPGFDTAIKAVKSELVLMKETTEHAPAELAAFIDIHTMFLEDPELVDKPREIIRERRCNAEWALVQQMEHLVISLNSSTIPTCASASLTWCRWLSGSSRNCSATPAAP